VLQAWLPLIVYQQIDAPEYREGFITVKFLSAALIVTAFVIRVLHARELAKARLLESDGEAESSEQEACLTKDDVIVAGK
jgi:hypothetical protein